MKKIIVSLFVLLLCCTPSPAQTYFAANDIELQQLLFQAETDPIGAIVLSGMNYKLDTMQFPVKLKIRSKRLSIYGQNACGWVDSNSVGFYRMPPNQLVADSVYAGYMFDVYNVFFNGWGSGTGIEFGAMKNGIIQSCTFYNLYDGLMLRFCLGMSINNCLSLYNLGTGFTATVGDWPGWGYSSSPSNCCVFNQPYVTMTKGQTCGIYIGASTACEVNGGKTEGGDKFGVGGKIAIYFDVLGSTNCNSFYIKNHYIEVKLTDCAIRLNGREGTLVVDGLRNVLDNVLISGSCAGYTTLKLKNVDKLTGGTKFKTANNLRWRVDSWQDNKLMKDSARWVGKKMPVNITIEA